MFFFLKKKSSLENYKKKKETTELSLKNILSLFTDESCAKRVFINNFKQKQKQNKKNKKKFIGNFVGIFDMLNYRQNCR
jgi:hypothetical protein